MPWNLLLLPLAAGYLWVSNSYSQMYRQQRLDNHRFLFVCILWGIIFLASTYIIQLLATTLCPSLCNWIHRASPVRIPYFIFSVTSFFLSVICTGIARVFMNRLKQLEKAIDEIGNDLERILKESVVNYRLLLFTLKNDKVYVGWVIELPEPTQTKYFKILPALSGKRNSDKNVEITVNYSEIYDTLLDDDESNDIIDTGVVIDVSNIITVSYFSWNIHDHIINAGTENQGITIN